MDFFSQLNFIRRNTKNTSILSHLVINEFIDLCVVLQKKIELFG